MELFFEISSLGFISTSDIDSRSISSSINTMDQDTLSREDRIKNLLQDYVKKDVAISNPVQEAYEKKLAKDIDRTLKFLYQAKQALENIDTQTPKQHDLWTEETSQKAHVLALYEVYQKLPYTVMKNDLLGTATAAYLTGEAVQQQTEASEALEKEKETLRQDLSNYNTTLSDYKTMLVLLEKRISSHPSRVEAIEQKLHNARHVEDELEEKTEQVKNATTHIRKVEEKLQQHMVRIVTKLHAMIDWENTGMVDEETFRARIKQSMQLIQLLVLRLIQDPENWVPVVPGSPEEQMVQLMHRNNLIEINSSGEFSIRLRNYGGEF